MRFPLTSALLAASLSCTGLCQGYPNYHVLQENGKLNGGHESGGHDNGQEDRFASVVWRFEGFKDVPVLTLSRGRNEHGITIEEIDTTYVRLNGKEKLFDTFRLLSLGAIIRHVWHVVWTEQDAPSQVSVLDAALHKDPTLVNTVRVIFTDPDRLPLTPANPDDKSLGTAGMIGRSIRAWAKSLGVEVNTVRLHWSLDMTAQEAPVSEMRVPEMRVVYSAVYELRKADRAENDMEDLSSP